MGEILYNNDADFLVFRVSTSIRRSKRDAFCEVILYRCSQLQRADTQTFQLIFSHQPAVQRVCV